MRRNAIGLDWVETSDTVLIRHPGLHKYLKSYKLNLKWIPRLEVLPPTDNSIKGVDLRKW